MPQYLISFDDGSMYHIPEADWPEVAEASHAVVRDAKAAGVWIFSPGLMPETKAVIGGFSIVEVPTRDEALAWAARLFTTLSLSLRPSA